MGRSPEHFYLELKDILELPQEIKVTAFKSDAIYHIKGGWYAVEGDIIYPDGSYDRYTVKAYTRRQLHEFYVKILHRGESGYE